MKLPAGDGLNSIRFVYIGYMAGAFLMVAPKFVSQGYNSDAQMHCRESEDDRPGQNPRPAGQVERR